MNVFTWYWKQAHRQIQYRAEHVQKLQSMVKRHLHLPHEFICITDKDVPNVNCIPPLPEMERVKNKRWSVHQPQCYRRLRMFDPDLRDILGDRYVQMDLDTVIVDDITPMLDRPDPLVINRSIGKRNAYNGSMWLHTPGTYSSIYSEFEPDKAIEPARRASSAVIRPGFAITWATVPCRRGVRKTARGSTAASGIRATRCQRARGSSSSPARTSPGTWITTGSSRTTVED